MNDLRTAAQQALELLGTWAKPPARLYRVMDNLRAALAQEQADPVREPAYKVKVTGRWHDTEPLAAAFNLPDGEHLLYTARVNTEPVQEPVAVVRWNDIGHISWRTLVMLSDGTPLYTAPPRRTMVPLTEGEIDAEWHELDGEASPLFKRVILKFARAIEKASWEKNNGKA